MQREKKRLRQANGNAYIILQLSCEELPYDLVSLAKTEELPDGHTRDAWEKLTSEYDLTEGEVTEICPSRRVGHFKAPC